MLSSTFSLQYLIKPQVWKMLLLCTICLIFMPQAQGKAGGKRKGTLTMLLSFPIQNKNIHKFSIYLKFKDYQRILRTSASETFRGEWLSHMPVWPMGLSRDSKEQERYYTNKIEIIESWSDDQKEVKFWPWRGLKVHSEQLSGT